MKTILKAAIAAVPFVASAFATATAGPVHANVFTFQNPDGSNAAGNVVGKGKLRRMQSGVRLTIRTSDLQPGHAYTIWWVIFNNPEACNPNGCSDADFGTPAVNASVLNATGGIVGPSGDMKFDAFLPVGMYLTNPSDEFSDADFNRHLFGPGLQNLKGAEIHAVVRSHGPANGQVKQLSTFNGYCLNPGPLACFDPQAVVFSVPGN